MATERNDDVHMKPPDKQALYHQAMQITRESGQAILTAAPFVGFCVCRWSKRSFFRDDGFPQKLIG